VNVRRDNDVVQRPAAASVTVTALVARSIPAAGDPLSARDNRGQVVHTTVSIVLFFAPLFVMALTYSLVTARRKPVSA